MNVDWNSWLSLLTDTVQGRGGADTRQAAIFSLDGTVLASSDESVSEDEVQGFMRNLDDAMGAPHPVIVAGTRYIPVHREERRVYARQGQTGALLIRGQYCIVEAVHHEHQPPQAFVAAIEHFMDKLEIGIADGTTMSIDEYALTKSAVKCC
eukprot:CAMPEP_0117020896 /NCGR_PEP_ID=MMETSP0472-20121206/15826_1 /TAXON_ID=693140 ORGANISM="Tiarina fusus, Strain LIS" /NCGR_SAMPLE_ID=MMETSP0472 /ASSEMBLY_ACC=CAM_ASM_000603 /LENGTH=151 /DNA_ID=CAMNT_0004726223 /DNA_START=12 /DNA_END=467 /DNA_ORIENTATION=-